MTGGNDLPGTGNGNGSGNDKLYGGNGHDYLLGEDGDDLLYGENDNDDLRGWLGRDTLYGGNGNDKLYGEQDNDTLLGDSGNDVLVGGSGADELLGGGGRDFFKYLNVSDSTPTSRDTVDLHRGDDVIDLSAIDANLNVAGNQAFEFIGAEPFSGSGGNGQVRYDAANNLIQAEINGDDNLIVDLEIKFSVSFNELAASDFIL